MRLLDQIVQARSPLEIIDGVTVHRFAGASDYAEAVCACPIRFIVDERAAAQCLALLETDRGMLAAENGFMRLPTTSFWLEWPCPPCPGAGSRTGLLVEADDRGRAGRVTTFWEQTQGEPVPAQALVEFDLDSDCTARVLAGDGSAILPGGHPLAAHLLFHLEERWLAYLALNGGMLTASVRMIVSNIIPGLEFLFVFSALLSERASLEQHAVDLSLLNRQRAKRGKPALLNHIEVRLDLAGKVIRSSSQSAGEREAARLHHVRGHMVSRQGAKFWRRAHLRGDVTRHIGSRTVTVTKR